MNRRPRPPARRKLGHTRRVVSFLAFFGAALSWAAPLLAHERHGTVAGLLAGLYHPVSGLDHVLAMIAVGLWGAQLGAPALWLLPVTFPVVMAFGGALGLAGLGIPGVEIGIALSAVLLGAMVLGEVRPPPWVSAGLVGALAIFHGHAHGTELPQGESALLYSLGFVMATGALHGAGIALGLVHRRPVGKSALRAVGAAVAMAGLFFLWNALR
ncbi:MAG TPA: HupE/UreJ family protein [Thermoanaerobaculia bacterium]|nr:HupE/UreJ family protein [Thermoanaerobaculia bacterium]